MLPRSIVFVSAAFALLATTGCVKSMIMNGQIEATRRASVVVDSIEDYELARSAAASGITQLEGMHFLAPDNEDALFMLTKSWTGYATAFPQDDYETAYANGDDDVAEYHRRRARRAFEKAIGYGEELLGRHASGYADAKKSPASLRTWLKSNFTDVEDAATLFWLGYARLGRIGLFQDETTLLGELFVPVEMLERSRELDGGYYHASATVVLAAYHARSPMAEMDQARDMFEAALAQTGRKSLNVQVNYAIQYACKRQDKALYERLLSEVTREGDPDPTQRLPNLLARRKAARASTEEAKRRCGFEFK
ncbi:MAG: TRAP transporter TatT component family protein [Polyangiaceae bacterium]